MNLIEYVGPPCSGKTTQAISRLLELKQAGISVGFIPEIAQLEIYRGSDLYNPDIGYKIITDTVAYLRGALNLYDTVIVDGSIALPYFYYNKNQADSTEFTAKSAGIHLAVEVPEIAKTTLYTDYLRCRDTYSTAGRIHTKEESLQLQDEIFDYCKDFYKELSRWNMHSLD